jgi:hypothetical protein
MNEYILQQLMINWANETEDLLLRDEFRSKMMLTNKENRIKYKYDGGKLLEIYFKKTMTDIIVHKRNQKLTSHERLIMFSVHLHEFLTMQNDSIIYSISSRYTNIDRRKFIISTGVLLLLPVFYRGMLSMILPFLFLCHISLITSLYLLHPIRLHAVSVAIVAFCVKNFTPYGNFYYTQLHKRRNYKGQNTYNDFKEICHNCVVCF